MFLSEEEEQVSQVSQVPQVMHGKKYVRYTQLKVSSNFANSSFLFSFLSRSFFLFLSFTLVSWMRLFHQLSLTVNGRTCKLIVIQNPNWLTSMFLVMQKLRQQIERRREENLEVVIYQIICTSWLWSVRNNFWWQMNTRWSCILRARAKYMDDMRSHLTHLYNPQKK